MLLTALATSPHTPPETLAAIARSPGVHSEHTTLALLLNPALPPDAPLTHRLVDRDAVHAALAHGNVALTARARLLTHHDTGWAYAAMYPGVSTAEILAMWAIEPTMNELKALALARNPASPRPLAADAVAFLADPPTTVRRELHPAVLASWAMERGVLLPANARNDLHRSALDLTTRYLTARRTDRDLTWADHLRATLGPTQLDTRRALGGDTSDPEIAELAHPESLLRNTMLLPAPALQSAELVHDLSTEALYAMLRTVTEDDALAVLRQLASGTPSTYFLSTGRTYRRSAFDVHVPTVLRNPLLSGAAVAEIFDLVRASTRGGSYADADRDTMYLDSARLALALHPNATPQMRRSITSDRFGDEGLFWRKVMEIVRALEEPGAILDIRVPALRRLERYDHRPLIVPHLANALAHIAGDITPDHATTIAMLSQHFTGSVRGLIDTARAVTA